MAVFIRETPYPLRPAEQGGGDTPSRPRGMISERSTTIKLRPGGPTRDDVRSWMRAQVPYPNLAGDPKIHDRARSFVRTQLRYYVDRTYELRDKWRTIDAMLRGSSLSSRFATSDIHVPELYKAVETLVPRIEEAVFGNGPGQPWFNVLGRDPMDKRRAHRIRAWLEYLLEEAKFDEEMVQQAARAMIVYGFFCIKSWWEIKFDRRIERTAEQIQDGDSPDPKTKITVREMEKLVKFGPRYELVDPYDFLVDVRSTDVQKGTFVGDVGQFTYEELLEYQRNGWFKNVEQIKGQEALYGDATDRRWAKWERSLTGQTGIYDQRKAEGEPEKYDVYEIWGLFDPYGVGNAEEYVITMANQNVVLRVQRNFHDDRHRPYAVGRAAREPFDFHNVGVLDHAVRLNIEFDDHRNLAMRGHENSLCPKVWVPNTADMPPNIWDDEPGTVYRTDAPPNFFASPPVVEIMQAMEQTIRRDIEEIAGSPRIYEGQAAASETATGITRKIEEGNRRLRAVIRSYSAGMRQMLEHTHALSGQFVTRKETFRVLGRDATLLGPHSDIGPQDLGVPVDFKMIGLDSAHSLGLRTTNMATFFNQIYPIVANFGDPASINWNRLMALTWDYMVGTVPGEHIFPDDSTDELAVTPELENTMMAMGDEWMPVEADDDPAHIRSHKQWVAENDPKGHVLALFMKHIYAHGRQQEQKQLREQQRQKRLEKMQAMGGAEPTRELGGQGRGPGREPNLQGTSPYPSPPGETPGPPAAERMGAPDRSMPSAQSENGASAV